MRLLALSAAVLAVGAAAPPNPLANVAAANGHPGGIHFRATGTRTIDGRHVALTIEQLGSQRLLQRCIAEVCIGSWFDGERLSTFGLNAVTLPEEDDALTPVRRTLAAIATYAFAEPAFRAAGGSVAEDGPLRWRVRAAHGAELMAQFDPRTLALRRVVDERGNVLAEYEHEVRAGGAAFALDRRGIDEGLVDAVEAVPGPLTAPEGVPAVFSGEARVQLTGDPIPIVPCTLAGRAARCLLDSGATPSALALPLVEALGLEPRGEIEIRAFSRFATGFVESGPLALGAAHFAHVRFAVVPAVGSGRFDVVIGNDLLARMHVIIDRTNGFARIEAPGGAPARNLLPLTFQAGVPLVDALLDGEPAHALLDTGDASTVSLGYADYRRGPQWPVSGRAVASGVAGAADAFLVTIPNVRLGAETLGPTRAAVSRTQDRVHVGIGIWTRCVVDLDVPQERFGCLARR